MVLEEAFLIEHLRQTRDALDVLSVVSDEFDESGQKRRAPPRKRTKVDLSQETDENMRKFFRFTYPELLRLAAALELPESIISDDNNVREDRVVALAMLCARLAWPHRLIDLDRMFGWESSRVSRLTYAVSSWIFERWKHLLRWNRDRLTPETLRRYADALGECGCPLKDCWGFIDGTLRRVARPDFNQRAIYNGWKRCHALKFHVICTPDGLHAHVFGPVEGRRHDLYVYNVSGLEDLLERYAWNPDGETPMQIYGDPAYTLSPHLCSPFPTTNATAEERLWNRYMSRIRESVEWSFGMIGNLWSALDFPRHNKVLVSPVGLNYLVAVILANAHACLHPNQISQHFHCPPPSLETYLSGEPTEDDDKAFESQNIKVAPIWEVWYEDEEGRRVEPSDVPELDEEEWD